MKSIRRSLCILALMASLVALAWFIFGAGERGAFVPPPDKYVVRILRDEWGVPHIFGKTDAAAAYGLAYAQCEDNWRGVEESILTARGLLASVKGQDEAKSDYMLQLFKTREFVDAKYERELSPELRALVEGCADGINHYASLHRDKMPHLKLPVTGRDIVTRTSFTSPFFYELQRDLEQWMNPPDDKLTANETETVDRVDLKGEMVIGSNTFAVAPSRSADGFTRLAVNSHMPWSGPVEYYEAHVHSNEGWNMVGCTMPGAPLIFMGHDENKGWCHTINRPDLADIYKLEVNPDNPNQYKFDGAWRDLERGTAHIKVKLWHFISWTFKREMLWSVQGPVARTPKGLYAIRFAGYGDIQQLEQWYRMNKARNLTEFKDAMRLLALPSLNTVYADKGGNLFYLYGARIPVRDESYDWTKPVPGNTSNTLWTEVYPFEKLPQATNPPAGFLQSCNSTPFHATSDGAPDPAAFPKAMGIEKQETNRSRRAQALFGGDTSITREEFYAYKHDKTLTDQSDVAWNLDKLFKKEVPQELLLQEAAKLLKDWDHTVTKENSSAALALLTGWNHNRRGAWLGKDSDPVNVLRQAALLLKEHYGRLDVPLEQVLRLRRGTVDLGLGGGPDCLRAVYFDVSDDGHMLGVGGDCYYQMVEWDKEGRLHSEVIHQYGNATGDEDSPHYSDQAPMFAEEKLRPALMTEQEVREHLRREYRPGEFSGAWYRQ